MHITVYIAIIALSMSTLSCTPSEPQVVMHDIIVSPGQPPVEISRCAMRAFWQAVQNKTDQATKQDQFVFCHSGRDDQELRIYRLTFAGWDTPVSDFRQSDPHKTALGVLSNDTHPKQTSMIIQGQSVHSIDSQFGFMQLAMSDADLVIKHHQASSQNKTSLLSMIDLDIATRLVWQSFGKARKELSWHQENGFWVATRCEKIETAEPVDNGLPQA